jgi:hypothetical protein
MQDSHLSPVAALPTSGGTARAPAAPERNTSGAAGGDGELSEAAPNAE